MGSEEYKLKTYHVYSFTSDFLILIRTVFKAQCYLKDFKYGDFINWDEIPSEAALLGDLDLYKNTKYLISAWPEYVRKVKRTVFGNNNEIPKIVDLIFVHKDDNEYTYTGEPFWYERSNRICNELMITVEYKDIMEVISLSLLIDSAPWLYIPYDDFGECEKRF